MPDVSHVADVTCNAVVPPLSRQCLIHTRGREFRSARGLEAVEPRATHTRYNARRPTVRRLHLALFSSCSFVSFRSVLHSTQLTESSPSRVESESSLSGVERSGVERSRFFLPASQKRSRPVSFSPRPSKESSTTASDSNVSLLHHGITDLMEPISCKSKSKRISGIVLVW